MNLKKMLIVLSVVLPNFKQKAMGPKKKERKKIKYGFKATL